MFSAPNAELYRNNRVVSGKISKCNKVESQLRADAISTIGLGGGGLSYDRGGDQSVWPNLFLTPKSDHFKL